MKTRTPKFGTQEQRTAAAKAKLLVATIELLAEHGPHGFSLADVGERAGVSRGLVLHHFEDRAEVLDKAATQLFERHPDPPELGLKPLLEWMRAQLERAQSGELASRALLQLLLTLPSTAAASRLDQHMTSLNQLVQRHLERARVLTEVRVDVAPEATAPLLVAQLVGELTRLARGGSPQPDLFIDLVTRALAREASGEVRSRKPKGPASPPRQQKLF